MIDNNSEYDFNIGLFLGIRETFPDFNTKFLVI